MIPAVASEDHGRFDRALLFGWKHADIVWVRFVDVLYHLPVLLMIVATQALSNSADIVRIPIKSKGAGPLFQIHYGAEWGYMDRAGRIIIPPEFDDEGDFFGGLARVLKSGKWGYVNEAGRIVIPCQFEHVGNFKEGLAPVQSNRQWGFIDPSGKFAITAQFQAAADFSDGLAVFEVWDTISCDGMGSYTKENAPLWVFRLHNTRPVVASSCFSPKARYGFVDKQGHIAIPPSLPDASDFSEGLAPARLEQPSASKWGYIGKSGKMVIDPQFDQAYPFSDGLAAVETGFLLENGRKVAGAWGFINGEGKFAAPPQFESVDSFSGGLADVCTRLGSCGYIAKNGAFVIPPKFSQASPFSDGLALVSSADDDDGDSYYIDKFGNKALTPELNCLWPFSDGLTIAGPRDSQKYIDKKGRTVAPYEVELRK